MLKGETAFKLRIPGKIEVRTALVEPRAFQVKQLLEITIRSSTLAHSLGTE